MKFNAHNLAKDTMKTPAAKKYTSWLNVSRLLLRRGFNVFEAEALLCSDHMNFCAKALKKPATSNDFGRYLDANGLIPGCAKVNTLVFNTFEKEYDLVLDDQGFPCRRGTMPGNPGGGLALVRLGTPLCCDPTSETYWSM
jgi:hypothetical protein